MIFFFVKNEILFCVNFPIFCSIVMIDFYSLFFSYAKRTSKAKVFSWKQANHFAKVTPEWEFEINHRKSKKKMYIQPKPKLWAFSTSSSFLGEQKKIKTSLWRKIYEMKMWWSHFLFLLQKKYLLTNFTLFIIMLMYEIKNRQKFSSEIFTDFLYRK